MAAGRVLHALLLCVAACISCARAATDDAGTAPQTLDALVADFHAGLRRAASEREALQTRMESTRELIRDLFANEREETQLHAVEVRFKVNAVREGMRAEMHNAAREIRQQIVYATQNVSALAKRRETARQQRQRAQSKNAAPSSAPDGQSNITESVKNAASSTSNDTEALGNTTTKTPATWQRAYKAAQIARAYASQTSSRFTATVSGWLNLTECALMDWPMRIGATAVGWMAVLWSVFFATIVGIVTTVWQLCLRLLVPVAIAAGLLLVAVVCVALYKAWQRAKRKQRVLYSEYLKTPQRRSKSDKAARTARQTHVAIQQRSQRRVSVSTGDPSSFAPPS